MKHGEYCRMRQMTFSNGIDLSIKLNLTSMEEKYLGETRNHDEILEIGTAFNIFDGVSVGK
jgi:hypothetical protein